MVDNFKKGATFAFLTNISQCACGDATVLHHYTGHTWECKCGVEHPGLWDVHKIPMSELSSFYEVEENLNPETTHPTDDPEYYRKLKIQPCDVIGQFMESNGPNIPSARAYDICETLKYLMRAGLKGDWAQDAQKAGNHLHRARTGLWPWEDENDD